MIWRLTKIILYNETKYYRAFCNSFPIVVKTINKNVVHTTYDTTEVLGEHYVTGFNVGILCHMPPCVHTNHRSPSAIGTYHWAILCSLCHQNWCLAYPHTSKGALVNTYKLTIRFDLTSQYALLFSSSGGFVFGNCMAPCSVKSGLCNLEKANQFCQQEYPKN